MADQTRKHPIQSWMRAVDERNFAVLDELLLQVPSANVPDHSTRSSITRWLADLHATLPQETLRFADAPGFWEKLAERWTSYTPPRQTAIGEASGTLPVRVAEGKAVDGWFVDETVEHIVEDDSGSKATTGSMSEDRARTAAG